MALTDKLTAIANAIREKSGGTDKLTLDQMAAAIGGLGSCDFGTEDLIAGESPLATGTFYFFVDESTRSVKKIYIGDNGVAVDWYTQGRVTLNDLNVGASVFMNFNGVRTEFIIVHKGRPNVNMYDTSCDGIWLLMKDCDIPMQFDTEDGDPSNDYESSSIRMYLNNACLKGFDRDIQDLMKNAYIPYVKDYVNNQTPLIGENGLPSKLFLLSYHEVRNIGTKSQPNDGAILDYFRGASDPKRIAYRNGAAVYWTLRTPHNPAYLTGNVSYAEAYCVSTPTGGDGHGLMTSVSPCVRPAMIMPMNTMVDGQNNIIT